MWLVVRVMVMLRRSSRFRFFSIQLLGIKMLSKHTLESCFIWITMWKQKCKFSSFMCCLTHFKSKAIYSYIIIIASAFHFIFINFSFGWFSFGNFIFFFYLWLPFQNKYYILVSDFLQCDFPPYQFHNFPDAVNLMVSLHSLNSFCAFQANEVSNR